MNYTERLQQYSTIINYLKSHGKGTKKQLMNRLDEKGYNVSHRTFDRLKSEMKYSFGIDLQYENRAYHLKTNPNPYRETLFRLLDLISEMEFFQNAIKNPSYSERILFDETSTPGFYQWLPDFFQAIIEKKIVRIHYLFFETGEVLDFDIHPMLLKEYMRRWYVIAFNPYKKDFRTYALDRVKHAELLAKNFQEEQYEEIKEKLSNYVGLDHSGGIERLVLRSTNKQSKYLDTLPLHESQKIIKANDEFTWYEYTLGINYELLQKILMLGPAVTVTSPDWMIDWIKNSLNESLNQYK